MNTNNNKSHPARAALANTGLLFFLFMVISVMVPADIPLSPIHSAWGMSGCGGMMSNTVRLDAMDTTITSPYTAAKSKINTKVAATAFSLTIVGLKSNDTADSAFDCNVTVTVLGSTSAGGVGSSCASGTTLKSVTVSLTNGVGTLSVTNANITNVWRDVRVKLDYNGGGMGMGDINSCSRDNFAIRPDHFDLSVFDATWKTAWISGTPKRTLNSFNIPNPASDTIHVAGQPFTIQATAVNGQGATTSQYSGSPTVNAGTNCALLAPCTFGTLSLGSWSSSGAVVTTTTASYSEVGVLYLKLEDGVFANADAGETGETTGEQFIPTNITYNSDLGLGVGRFVPDHFVVTVVGTLSNRSDVTGGSGSTFTYMGEPMALSSTTIKAKLASGGDTLNYKGSFATLVLTNFSAFGFGAVDTGTNLSARLSGTTSSVNGWVNGTVNDVIGTIQLNRKVVSGNITPDGPYNAVNFGLAPVDPDGITLLTTSPNPLNLDVVSGGGNDHQQIDADINTAALTTIIRFGRMSISSAYGPSTSKLTMPMKVEYCSANCTTTPVFIANPLDSLTPLAVGTFQLSSQTGGLAAYTTAKLTLGGAAFASGLQSVDVAMPASAGSMDVAYNLAAMTYLQTGATYTQNPKARVTFGIYRNPNSLVYMRESF
jgi:hypothetical protein